LAAGFCPKNLAIVRMALPDLRPLQPPALPARARLLKAPKKDEFHSDYIDHVLVLLILSRSFKVIDI